MTDFWRGFVLASVLGLVLWAVGIGLLLHVHGLV